MRPTQAVAALLLLLLLGGCELGGPRINAKPGTVEATSALPNPCLDPLQGSQYQVCGRLSTTGVDPPTTGRWVVGSVDASQADVSGKEYRLVGGTFHADH
jgi:hypothetical protein